jgi:hypothetical protein
LPTIQAYKKLFGSDYLSCTGKAVFYKSEKRLGENNTYFHSYKYRTMPLALVIKPIT